MSFNGIMRSDYWLSRILQGIVGTVQMTIVVLLVFGGLTLAWGLLSMLLRGCGIIVVPTDDRY